MHRSCWALLLFVCTGLAQENVTFLSQVPLNQFSLSPSAGNDIWGFTDANGVEYAIMGTRNGTAVFDLSDPSNPVEVGSISGPPNTWRDIKVYTVNDTPGSFEAYAYVTTEASGAGVQIIDLSDVPNGIKLANTYTGLSSAHNVFMEPNATDPYVYILGANIAGGGVVVLDVTDPINPTQIGAWNFFYAHDFYMGDHWADPAYDGTDIGLAFCGGNNMSVIDFSDKTNPQTIDNYTYPNIGYVHSGWVSQDGRYVFVCDELDEQNQGINTTIRVIDLIDMENPELVFTWTGPTGAIDHNAFVKGGFLHLSNYRRGYTILDISDPLNVEHYGFYDTYPSSDSAQFNGAWGVYPYYESGIVAISDIEAGLFILRPDIDPGFDIQLDRSTLSTCVGTSSQSVTITTTSILDFQQPITLTLTGLPAEVSPVFSTNPVVPGQSTELTFDVDAGAAIETLVIGVDGAATGAAPKSKELILALVGGADPAPTLTNPIDDATCVGRANISFQWEDLGPGRSYHFQLSDDPGFATIAAEEWVTQPNLILTSQLVQDTTYYWRVNSENACASGAFSPSRSLFTSLPSILLVDDDDNSPDVRSFYSDLLDGLGLPYNVWDIGDSSADGPSLADMQNYQWLIWFSGDQYGSNQAGPTSTDEANLTTFLSQGGYLFLSSQDYYYDMGNLTAFMADQLGLASVGNDDGSYSQATGLGSFSAYGNVSLSPTVGSEYFDVLNPSTGELVFEGNNGQGAAVRTSNTLFTGFTFATLIQNNPGTAGSIIEDLFQSYGISCQLQDPCDAFDLDGNGVDMSDLMAMYPQWNQTMPFPDFIEIVNCL